MGWVVVGWLEGSWDRWLGASWGGWYEGSWVGWCVVVWVVVGAWWGGWLESSLVGEYMHPPHPGVLGMMGRWVWA